MNLGLITWIAVCLVVTGLGTYTGHKNLRADWAQTPAHFERYEIVSRKKTTTRHRIVVHYAYTVAGTAHSGKDYSLFGKTYATPEEARLAMPASFPTEPLIAHYDKNNPAFSDLNPLSRSTAWSYIYLPPLIMAIGIGLFLLGPKLKLNELLTKR
ncbi:MAG: DUF3592 domain-containing protein [Rariglobus sp.]|nr:DUF3592 domain-containing protein [Rariglobus sp.]